MNLSFSSHCIVEDSEMYFQATIPEPDFEDYSSCIQELEFRSYDDFVLERDGFFIGLSWAGDNIVQVMTPFRLFKRWLDLTGVRRSLESLDDFAMRRWLRSEYPNWSAQFIDSAEIYRAPARSDRLYIPTRDASAETWRKRGRFARSAETLQANVAGAIARECLDPAA
jgi:hypothetical protein